MLFLIELDPTGKKLRFGVIIKIRVDKTCCVASISNVDLNITF